jgi:flagellin
MAQVVNTNILSLNAQRNLNSSQGALATSLERLSSGLRINSAKDDAAGLAISERFTSQIRGLNQAVRNANDGISLAQTAEGAMQEIGNNLQRIRELAVQSSNATNSSSDRAALNQEVQQLLTEIQRVATQTDFNGQALLDGSFTGQSFQVGANAGQLITVNASTNTQTNALGSTQFAEDVTGTVTAGDGTAEDYISGLTINGVTIDDVADTGAAADNATALAAAINEKAGETGVYASADGAALTLQSLVAGRDLVIGGTVTNTGLTEETTAAADNAEVFVGGVDISSFGGAQQALGIMDAALTEVNSARAEFGAIQNRFESVIANLQTGAENLSAARSRIRDADFAAETAELTRSQILQQAGISVLAQANATPQSVLALLQ